MAPLTGTYKQEHVPEKELPVVVAGYKAQGATVETVNEGNGLWTVIARFPDKQSGS